jgi:hypothetical protein
MRIKHADAAIENSFSQSGLAKSLTAKLYDAIGLI